MIKLERLHVESFKRLSGIDLSFPARCCVLIEGQNEAGKSSLFESIYFALYGDALVKRGGGRGQIASAVCHGVSEAFVALTISIGDTQLEIQRSIFRRRSNTAQLVITYPGRAPETVSSLSAVNSRLIEEMNGLDGEALLNSCFVEQKRLDKLEGSDRAKREQVLLKLLDMERLTDLTNVFKWRHSDGRELDIAKDKLRLVQAAGELNQAEEQLAQVEHHLKLVAIHLAFNEIDQQTEIIQKQATEQENWETEVKRLDKQLSYLNDLRSAEAALKAIQNCLNTIASYEGEVQRLQGELNDLDRLEHEEIPNKQAALITLETLEKELKEINKLETAQHQAQTTIKRLSNILNLANQLKDPKSKLASLPEEEQVAQNNTKKAEKRLKAARTIESLQRWMTANRAGLALADADKLITDAQEQTDNVRRRKEALTIEQKSSKTVPVAIALLLIGLTTGGLAILFRFTPLWVVAVVSIIAGVAVGIRGVRQWQNVKTHLETCDRELQERERVVNEQERRKETVMEQRPPELEACEFQLNELQAQVPKSEGEAEKAIVELEREHELQEYDTDALVQAVTEAKGRLSALNERRTALETQVGKLHSEIESALNEEGLIDIDTVSSQTETLKRQIQTCEIERQEKWTAIADDLERFKLFQETGSALNGVAGQIGKLDSQVRELEVRVQGRSNLTGQMEDWRTHIAGLEEEIQNHREELAELSEKVGDPIIVVPDDEMVSQALTNIRIALQQLDETQLKREHNQAQRAAANAQATIQQSTNIITSAQDKITQSLMQMELPVPDKLTREAITSLDPEFDKLLAEHKTKLEKKRDELIGRFTSREDEIKQLENKLHIHFQELDEAHCQSEVEKLEEQKLVCSRARPIIDAVRERMLSQILPGTIAHMQLLVPLLTAGRYHHAELDPTNYKIRVWDTRAGEQGEYVEKDFFSGGTQDQFSLALRLGFALAALPQELGTSPGFIFLDEPLSAFDRQRTTALIKILTEGEVAQRFDQIFLIAHDRTFERHPFPYHIRLENGQIVESNLNSK